MAPADPCSPPRQNKPVLIIEWIRDFMIFFLLKLKTSVNLTPTHQKTNELRRPLAVSRSRSRFFFLPLQCRPHTQPSACVSADATHSHIWFNLGIRLFAAHLSTSRRSGCDTLTGMLSGTPERLALGACGVSAWAAAAAADQLTAIWRENQPLCSPEKEQQNKL